jgi:hypothetical protein
MVNPKCRGCGLVNFADSDACRRCGERLSSSGPGEDFSRGPSVRGFGRSLLWVSGATLTLLITSFLSLLATSESLDDEQRRTVARATRILEQAGFAAEAFMLNTFVSYRRTDHWWNRHVGHQSAYAATNFPFCIVTLYPAFFAFAVDDTERAAILLHESYHLRGAGEETALRRVWFEKSRFGWTAEHYSQTRVWKNTREWTVGSVPALFRCGDDRRSDCLE